MPKFEKPQKGNPHKLAIKQHVFPAISIARFAGEDGRVSLSDMQNRLVRRAKPTDDIFCAHRAWNQRAEVGFMKEIEDAFQPLVDSILEGAIKRLGPKESRTVSEFYSLWYMRSRQRHLPTQHLQLHGVTSEGLTQDQEEMLEKKGGVVAARGGKIATRHINGVQLQIKTYRFADQVNEDAKWGIIWAQEGEFIVPDTPMHDIIPLSPIAVLTRKAPASSGIIVKSNVAAINQALALTAQRYLFARELSKCPF